MSKMIPDGLLAPREVTERKNQKVIWPFGEKPFKYPLGVVLSISMGGATIVWAL